MEKHIPETYYVIGDSRTDAANAITKIYGGFYHAFEVDGQTDEVVAYNCTHTLELTERYLQKLFVGKNFLEIDSWLDEALMRYGGTSRKAVQVAYRDALKRYLLMKKQNEMLSRR